MFIAILSTTVETGPLLLCADRSPAALALCSSGPPVWVRRLHARASSVCESPCPSTAIAANAVEELAPAFATIGPVLEKFVSVDDVFEPTDDGSKSGVFISTSYDATSHFETTCDDILNIYKRITKEDFGLSACWVELLESVLFPCPTHVCRQPLGVSAFSSCACVLRRLFQSCRGSSGGPVMVRPRGAARYFRVLGFLGAWVTLLIVCPCPPFRIPRFVPCVVKNVPEHHLPSRSPVLAQ